MYKKMLIFALVFLSLAAASCVKSPKMPVMDVSLSLPADFSPEKYMFVKELNATGRLVFFYQDHEGYMHYYNGKEDRIINREVMDKYKNMGGVPMSMSYGYDGKHIYVSQPVRWGPKKLIFMKLEPNGSVVYTKELSSLEQVIKSASTAFDGKGNMLLTWIDETPPYIKGAYTLVQGDNFPEKEEVISYENGPVLSAQAVYTDKGFAVVYVRTGQNEGGEIRVRFLSDGSEKALYSGNVSDFDLAEENGTFIIRPYQAYSNTIKLLAFNASFDSIKEYTINNPKEIEESFSLFSNGRLIAGEPFVLGAGSPSAPVKVEGYSMPQKLNLYYSYAGSDFERVAGGRPFMFTSTLPSFDNSEEYTVLAYMDRRLAAPSVLLAVFDSMGKLIKRDIAIEKPWVETGSPRVAHLDGDLFRIFYPVEDKEKNVWTYRAKDIKADSIESLYQIPSLQEKSNLLTESVNKFVDCRKKNDYGCVYDMLDPTYRSGISKGEHEGMMKKAEATIIEYNLDCKILEESVLAVCDGSIKATLPGEVLFAPIKEDQRILEQRIKGDIWVFIDGKWHYAVDLPMHGYPLKW